MSWSMRKRQEYVTRIEEWMRTSVRFAGEPVDRLFGLHKRIAKCLKMAFKQEVILTEEGVNVWEAWLWDEETFAEGIERSYEPRLIE